MTNAEARCNKSLRPRKPEGSLGRTAQDVHLDSHTAPELWHKNTRRVRPCKKQTGVRPDSNAGDDDDDELMLNVLRCHLTY